MNSKLFRLGWRDLLKGAFVVVLAALFTTPVETLAVYIPALNNPTLAIAVSTLFAYLAKNLVTDENDKLGGKL